MRCRNREGKSEIVEERTRDEVGRGKVEGEKPKRKQETKRRINRQVEEKETEK